ncbi:Hypothetical protein D9617_24g017250 [Elsinoe fawcettii]|nr:Hypothetical protein D9617_24g017250 [Elsinoe fawcettii]
MVPTHKQQPGSHSGHLARSRINNSNPGTHIMKPGPQVMQPGSHDIFPLMKLPLELVNRILELVLLYPTQIHVSTFDRARNPIALKHAILATDRTLRGVAAPIWYGCNAFRFKNTQMAYDFILAARPYDVHIRTISVLFWAYDRGWKLLEILAEKKGGRIMAFPIREIDSRFTRSIRKVIKVIGHHGLTQEVFDKVMDTFVFWRCFSCENSYLDDKESLVGSSKFCSCLDVDHARESFRRHMKGWFLEQGGIYKERKTTKQITVD